jgi:hypothetical protein
MFLFPKGELRLLLNYNFMVPFHNLKMLICILRFSLLPGPHFKGRRGLTNSLKFFLHLELIHSPGETVHPAHQMFYAAMP